METVDGAPFEPDRRQWFRAVTALARLARNTADTSQVFEIIHALSGDNMQRTYERVLDLPEGRRLFETKPDLRALLEDRDALARLETGSLGREYLKFMLDGELTAGGLENAQVVAREHDESPPDTEAPRYYVERRLVAMHDLWHVLTGYGRDDTGELANLWFSYGQFSQLGMGFIALLGTLDGPVERHWYGFMREAHRRGKRAKLLVAAPMEEMLPLPIDVARRRLGITLPLEAHPEGILTGNRRSEGIGRGPRVFPTPEVDPPRLAGASAQPTEPSGGEDLMARALDRTG